MAFAEHLQIAKRVNLAATGDPGDIVTITLESGTPYRHVAMFLMGEAAGVTAQPLFAGANDGAATNVAGTINTKIYQIGVDEIRPATSGSDFTKPDAPIPMKSELRLTNTNANPAALSVYIMASAMVGGA